MPLDNPSDDDEEWERGAASLVRALAYVVSVYSRGDVDRAVPIVGMLAEVILREMEDDDRRNDALFSFIDTLEEHMAQYDANG